MVLNDRQLKKKKTEMLEKMHAQIQELKEQPQSVIKRPLSCFMLYFADHRGQVVKENPSFDTVQIGKKIGAMWNRMTQDQKNVYIQRAKQDKARYEAEIEAQTKDSNG